MSLASAHCSPAPNFAARTAALPLPLLLEAMTNALTHANMTLLLVDAGGRALFATASEEALKALGLTSWGGRLSGQATSDTRALRAAIADAISGKCPSTIVTMGENAEGPRLLITAGPAWAGGALSGVAMVMICGQQRALPQEHLRQAFDLTPAEARLLSALVAGERVDAYARRSGVTVTTVKAHLRQLFAKTGETRQADLIRLALSDPVLRLAPPTPA